MLFFFFFQAEDGIRDVAVTGVQTCALPIYASRVSDRRRGLRPRRQIRPAAVQRRGGRGLHAPGIEKRRAEIGRASCRGRVEISGVAGSLKKKKKKNMLVRV